MEYSAQRADNIKKKTPLDTVNRSEETTTWNFWRSRLDGRQIQWSSVVVALQLLATSIHRLSNPSAGPTIRCNEVIKSRREIRRAARRSVMDDERKYYIYTLMERWRDGEMLRALATRSLREKRWLLLPGLLYIYIKRDRWPSLSRAPAFRSIYCQRRRRKKGGKMIFFLFLFLFSSGGPVENKRRPRRHAISFYWIRPPIHPAIESASSPLRSLQFLIKWMMEIQFPLIGPRRCPSRPDPLSDDNGILMLGRLPRKLVKTFLISKRLVDSNSDSSDLLLCDSSTAPVVTTTVCIVRNIGMAIKSTQHTKEEQTPHTGGKIHLIQLNWLLPIPPLCN